jgi:hypothetical protein
MLVTLHIADPGRSKWEVDPAHIHFRQNGLWTHVTYDGEEHDVDESYDDIQGMVETAKAKAKTDTDTDSEGDTPQ